MAQLVLEVDDSKVQFIVDAFEYAFGPRNPQPEDDETIKEFLERHIKTQIKIFVKNQRVIKARNEASDTFVDPFEPVV